MAYECVTNGCLFADINAPKRACANARPTKLTLVVTPLHYIYTRPSCQAVKRGLTLDARVCVKVPEKCSIFNPGGVVEFFSSRVQWDQKMLLQFFLVIHVIYFSLSYRSPFSRCPSMHLEQCVQLTEVKSWMLHWPSLLLSWGTLRSLKHPGRVYRWGWNQQTEVSVWKSCKKCINKR